MLSGPGLLPLSGGKAQKLVVFVHGYGSSGNDLIRLAPYWAQELPDVGFLAPNAPHVWETHPSGFQWYSLIEWSIPGARAGLAAVRPKFKAYLQEVLSQHNLTPSDLVLVGFSQGGIVSLDMMFELQGLGGVICYSGGFIPPENAALLTPFPKVLLVHGDQDTVLPFDYFLAAQIQLKKLGLIPQTLTCRGLGHSIDNEGLKVGGEFLRSVFSQSNTASVEMKQQ